MAREILFVLAAGGASGLFCSSALAGAWGALIFFFLSLFILLLVGLSRGGLSAALAGLVGTVVVNFVGGGTEGALVYLFSNVIPSAWLSRQALLSRIGPSGTDWYPSGLIITWMCVFPTIYFLAGVSVFLDAPGGPQQGIAEALGVTPDLLALMLGSAPTQGLLPAPTDLTALLPGSLAAAWMIMMTINLLLAQAALNRLNKKRRPNLSLVEMQIPKGLLLAAAISILIATFPDSLGYIGHTLMVIFLVPYFFLGIVLFHVVSRSWPARRFLLFIFYLLLLLMGWSVVLVTVIGIVEHFAKFRRGLARISGGPKED